MPVRSSAKRKPKFILGLSGSPRKGGNTDILVAEVLQGARDAGAKTEFVRIADLKVSPCIACYYCASHHGHCVIEDDMQGLYELLREADAWVLGTPIYWFSMSAQMKAVTDRFFAFITDECHKLPAGKKAAVVTTCADEDIAYNAAAAFDAFDKSFKYLGVKFTGRLALRGVEKKDAAKKWSNFRKARQVGAKLAK
jgi:multimeric flavodoxin WrbA